MKRILTGERPTGKLHLGHYVGTLKNRVLFQNQYEIFIVIADLHMLTTNNSYQDILNCKENIRNIILDSLAVGVDPNKVHFYLQSAIPEIYEIYTLLQSLITVKRLERIPSMKQMSLTAGIKLSFALLGYPILQAADILAIKTNLVFVGKDNFPHVELAKEIVKKLNYKYLTTFPIPEIFYDNNRTLIGTCGKQKMSKSANNAIYLTDSSDIIRKKVTKMPTDIKRIHANLPGKIEGNLVFIYHDLFNENKNEVVELKTNYRQGNIGDVEVKEKLIIALNNFLNPFRKRRMQFEKANFTDELLIQGTSYARNEIKKIVYELKKAMGLINVKINKS